MTRDPDMEGGPAPCETLTLDMDGARHVVPWAAGETIVEAAFRAGLAPPVSCLAGACATCIARLTEGTVEMRSCDALLPGELDDGYVLTCQAVPTARVVTVVYGD